MMTNRPHRALKADNDLQIVWGEVYVPGFPDSQGDFMTTDTVRKMAHKFAQDAHLGEVDVMHDNKSYKAYVVESFVARKGDPDFIEGSWVCGVYVEDKDLWKRIRDGELNGFSLEALALRSDEPIEIDIELGDSVICQTVKHDGVDHEHQCRVVLDKDGNIVGGETDLVNGHRHLIKRGTITEDAEGHSHRYLFLEAVLA